MEYVFAFIVIIIVAIAALVIQTKTVGKLEKEKFVPILDSLYVNPTAKEQHQLFIEALKSLDAKIKEYKSGSFSYTPSDLITDKLLRHIEKYPQDRLAHERFMELISRSEQLSSESLFQKLLLQLKAKATPLSHERFAVCVSKARFLPGNLLESLFDYLDQDPVNPGVQQHFLQCAMHIILLPDAQRQRIYDKALYILESNPASSTAKQFVLTVGRWHFGKRRKDGHVTIYDEQRIQNDILARAA
jgi:hypothetical protein